MVFLGISQKYSKFSFNSNIITLLFFSFLLITKLIYLDSDTVAITNLHNEDEGNYIYNIRNYIVEEKLFKDDANFILLSPLYSFFVFIPVKFLGISIFSFRLISAISEFLLVVLFYIYFNKYGKSTGLIAASIIGTDFLFNIHSRIAMPEVTVSLFFFLVYITFINALKRNSLKLYMLTGLLSGSGFLIKSSAILMVFITCFYLILIEVIKIVKDKKTNYINFKYLVLHLALITVPAILPILFWKYIIIMPNIDHFELVSIVINTLHKPQIKEQLLNTIFLRNEFKEFIEGGEGKIWLYLLIYFATVFTGSAIYFQNKFTLKNHSFWFAVLWFIFGNIYFFILWYKPARWYIPNIIPLIIITVYILKELPSEIKYLLLTCIFIVNIFLNYIFIYKSPSYFLKNASIGIEKVVGSKTYAGDSLVLMNNKSSKVYNPYFIQPDYTTKTFDTFLKENSFPEYIVLPHGQYDAEIEKTGRYMLQKGTKIKSSNILNLRILDLYKKVN